MGLALLEAEQRGVPCTFYIRPSELDGDQPRLPVPLRGRLRHYSGLRDTVLRLRRLLSEFRFKLIAQQVLAPT